MKKVLLKIDGMTCSACSSGLEKYLNKQDGIISATVNLVMNNASVEYDEKKLDIPQIEKFIQKAGFESLGIDNLQKEEKKKSREKYKLWSFTAIAIITLYVAMGSMVGLPEIPILSMHNYPINYAIALLVFSIIAIIMGWGILKNGYKNLVHKTPNMDTLVGMGVLSSFIYSVYGTYMIIKGHHEYAHNLYFESAVIILFFIHIGRYVEARNKDKTKEAIQSLMMITPNKATIIKDGNEKEVTLDEIIKGDTVVCKPGEKIAVDGEVIDGTTHIDESFVTGESTPAKKEVGSKVIAGSINYEGTIKYKAEKIGKESTVSEIVRMVVEATNTKAPIAKIADKISGYFVPTIIILAFVSAIVWLIIGETFAFAINVFISILVVACPCSLGLATPLAIVVSSGVASKEGILIKNSESLENAHKVKTVVFDKTGTLTKGKLSVSKMFNYTEIRTEDNSNNETKAEPISEQLTKGSNSKSAKTIEQVPEQSKTDSEIIKIVASIENKSEHPIARGIVNYATEKNIKLAEVENFKNIAGYGISAEYDGNKYLIGNSKLMKENNVDIESKLQDEEELEANGNSILFVAESRKEEMTVTKLTAKATEKIGNKMDDEIEKLQTSQDKIIVTKNNKEEKFSLIALIGVKDVIKDSAKDVVEKLQKQKVSVVMLTGDNEKTAKAIANSIGITEVIANVLPKEKAEKIKELKQNGLVMMCGDGINDSVSLVTADIGVAVGSGTDIAMDSSDVVLMKDDLEKIPELMKISKKTIRNIKQNLFWAFFYNLCMIPIAIGVLSPFGITMNPMFASLAMTLSSITVTLNSLRLKKMK